MSSVFVSELKTDSIRNKSSMVMTADCRMRSDSSGSMHWMNILIPWSGDFRGPLMVLTRSIKIYLSERLLSGSLNPGVSIKVMLPLVASLTSWVTDSKDFDDSNSTCTSYFDLL